MNSAQVERNLAQSDLDLFECDRRRQAGADAWPKAPEPPETR